jgi:succinoglycan biosynthesis protein ExoA
MSPADSCLLCPVAADAALPALPLVSVVVPVRNEAPHIEHLLAELVAQRYDPERFEILVVDGESDDGTPGLVAAFAARHPQVRLLHNPRRWSSAARNLGIRAARGEIVVIVDGHCELEGDQFLARLADAFTRSDADCLGRPQPLDLAGASHFQKAVAAARSSRLGHHPDSYIYASGEGYVPASSVATAYRRRVFDTVGLFDEQFDACEDVEFNHRVDRAGLRCYFTPQVAVRYQPRATVSGLFRQMVRYGRGRVRLAGKHPETLALRTFLPLLFVVGVLAGGPLSILLPWLAGPFTAALACYALAVLLTSVGIAASRRDHAMLSRIPLAFAAIHFGAGVGMLWECLRAGVMGGSRWLGGTRKPSR